VFITELYTTDFKCSHINDHHQGRRQEFANGDNGRVLLLHRGLNA